MKFRYVLFVALLLPLAAFAQNRNAIEVSLTGGKSITNWHGQADVQVLTVGLVRPFTKHTDISVLLTPIHLWQPRSWFGDQYKDGNESAQAIGAAILLRRTFGFRTSNVQYYFEGGTGPLIANKRVPAATSHFNFMSQAGAGLILRPNSPNPILLGYKFLHISNGGYASRNPGLNVSSLLVGMRFNRGR